MHNSQVTDMDQMAAGRMQRQAVLLPPRGHSQGSTAAAHLRVLILSVAREALQHRGPEGGHPAPLARHIQHGGGLQGREASPMGGQYQAR